MTYKHSNVEEVYDIPLPGKDPWIKYVPIVSTPKEDGVGTQYSVYLTQYISDPYVYSELVELLYTVKQNDRVIIMINNPGGDLDTGIMIVNAIKECIAETISIVSGAADSCATIIALACDGFKMNPYSEFMIHMYSAGMYGKSHELAARHKFTEDNIREFFRDIYLPFLTEQELDDVFKGLDKYIGSVEAAERWLKVVEKRQQIIDDDATARDEANKETIVAYLIEQGYSVTKADSNIKQPRRKG